MWVVVIGLLDMEKCPALCSLDIESRNIELDIMFIFQLFLVRRHHHHRLMEYRRWEPDG